jgi:hypothetical protein
VVAAIAGTILCLRGPGNHDDHIRNPADESSSALREKSLSVDFGASKILQGRCFSALLPSDPGPFFPANIRAKLVTFKTNFEEDPHANSSFPL